MMHYCFMNTFHNTFVYAPVISSVQVPICSLPTWFYLTMYQYINLSLNLNLCLFCELLFTILTLKSNQDFMYQYTLDQSEKNMKNVIQLRIEPSLSQAPFCRVHLTC